ncbi:unnamed protein product [Phaeothamnion confervicola]
MPHMAPQEPAIAKRSVPTRSTAVEQSRLFDYFASIEQGVDGLSVVQSRYPLADWSDYALPPNLAMCAIPLSRGGSATMPPGGGGGGSSKHSARGGNPVAGKPSFFTFVLTNASMDRRYAGSLIYYELASAALGPARATASPQEASSPRTGSLGRKAPSPPQKTRSPHTAAAAAAAGTAAPSRWVCRALCVVSNWPFFSLFEDVLFALHRAAHSGKGGAGTVPLERAVVNVIGEFPLPGHGALLAGEVCGAPVLFHRNSSRGLPYVHPGCLPALFRCLCLDSVVTALSLLAMEQRVALVTNSLALLTPCCEALLALLHPFQFRHVYAPVLPPDLVDYLEAPVPFLLGLQASALSRGAAAAAAVSAEVFFVYLDEDRIVGPDVAALPGGGFVALRDADAQGGGGGGGGGEPFDSFGGSAGSGSASDASFDDASSLTGGGSGGGGGGGVGGGMPRFPQDVLDTLRLSVAAAMRRLRRSGAARAAVAAASSDGTRGAGSAAGDARADWSGSTRSSTGSRNGAFGSTSSLGGGAGSVGGVNFGSSGGIGGGGGGGGGMRKRPLRDLVRGNSDAVDVRFEAGSFGWLVTPGSRGVQPAGKAVAAKAAAAAAKAAATAEAAKAKAAAEAAKRAAAANATRAVASATLVAATPDPADDRSIGGGGGGDSMGSGDGGDDSDMGAAPEFDASSLVTVSVPFTEKRLFEEHRPARMGGKACTFEDVAVSVAKQVWCDEVRAAFLEVWCTLFASYRQYLAPPFPLFAGIGGGSSRFADSPVAASSVATNEAAPNAGAAPAATSVAMGTGLPAADGRADAEATMAKAAEAPEARETPPPLPAMPPPAAHSRGRSDTVLLMAGEPLWRQSPLFDVDGFLGTAPTSWRFFLEPLLHSRMFHSMVEAAAATAALSGSSSNGAGLSCIFDGAGDGSGGGGRGGGSGGGDGGGDGGCFGGGAAADVAASIAEIEFFDACIAARTFEALKSNIVGRRSTITAVLTAPAPCKVGLPSPHGPYRYQQFPRLNPDLMYTPRGRSQWPAGAPPGQPPGSLLSRSSKGAMMGPSRKHLLNLVRTTSSLRGTGRSKSASATTERGYVGAAAASGDVGAVSSRMQRGFSGVGGSRSGSGGGGGGGGRSGSRIRALRLPGVQRLGCQPLRVEQDLAIPLAKPAVALMLTTDPIAVLTDPLLAAASASGGGSGTSPGGGADAVAGSGEIAAGSIGAAGRVSGIDGAANAGGGGGARREADGKQPKLRRTFSAKRLLSVRRASTTPATAAGISGVNGGDGHGCDAGPESDGDESQPKPLASGRQKSVRASVQTVCAQM